MNRKELIASYKARPVTGGVYRIINTENSRYLLGSGIDIKGDRNRFDFSVETGSCVHPKLKDDWKEFGVAAFDFEVLDELKKKPEQKIKEFTEDLKMLEQMWRERLNGNEY